jgi:hypothetical protein
MSSGYANFTGGARYPPRLDREGKLKIIRASAIDLKPSCNFR